MKIKKMGLLIYFYPQKGGEVYVAMAMYDLISSQSNEIIITGVGYVFSAGVVVIQAADKKVSFPNCRYMIHEISDGITGTHSSIKTDCNELEFLQKQYKEICGIRRMPRGNLYLSAEEAANYGIIDEVIES